MVDATANITQTSDGYIWTRTPAGLARFDGVQFVPWTPPVGTTLPAGVRTTALLGARDGSLWIGFRGGLGRIKDGQFRYYSKPGEQWGVNDIIEDAAGRIWATRYHVSHDADQQGAICEALDRGLHCYGPADGLPLRFGLGVAADHEGYLWIGSTMLCRWRPGSHCTTYLDQPSSADNVVPDVAAGLDGTLWATVEAPGIKGASGLYRFSDGKWSPFKAPGLDGTIIISETLLMDREGSLWVGTEKDGLYRIHNGVADHYGPADGLSGHEVAGLYEDREGNLWVTTDGGIDMFRNTPVITWSQSEGLRYSGPEAVLPSQDGSIWVGQFNGLDVLRDGVPYRLPGRTGFGPTTYSLYEDHAGTIWIGQDSLTTYNHGRISVVNQADGKPLSSDGSALTGLTEDTEHNVWALAKRQLFRIQHGRVQESVMLPDQFSPYGSLAPDLRSGGIWIGDGLNHIFHYHQGQIQETTLTNSGKLAVIHEMTGDSDDPLLVATGDGLFRWDGQRWTVMDTRNGLPCSMLLSVVKDKYGSLWMYAQCGLLRVGAADVEKWRRDPAAQVETKVFDRLDGAYPGFKLTAQPRSARAKDGRLWFANGVVVQMVDPDRLFPNRIVPPVHVESIIADGQVYAPEGSVRLPPRTRNLEIDYTALSLSIPQKVRFRYMLEGRDTKWQDPGTRRQAFYTDLPPEKYRFRVIASNNDGVWNEAGATLAFTLAPAFDQTVWFRAMCFAVIAGLLWALYLLRLRQATAQLHRLLEARLGERERIARDLHDTLLQSLQGLLLRFQAAANLLPARPEDARKRLDDAIEQTSQAIAEGRGAVQDLRASTTSTNDLAMAIKTIGEELAAEIAGPNAPEFEVVVEGPVQNLHPIVRDEVYRIAAEALRNAFRHAGASHVRVEVRYDSLRLRVNVRDDGKGFKPEVLETRAGPGHWGLQGMRERARLLGGSLEVWGKLQEGTEIELTVPASTAYETGTSPSHANTLNKEL